VFDRKETLLERPIRRLFDEPHFLSAWLSQHRRNYVVRDGRVEWQQNPVDVLAETYRLLDMDTKDAAPAHRIWDHDRALLDRAIAFYSKLATRVPTRMPWPDLDATLKEGVPAFGFDDAAWARVRAAHAGHQLGLEILALLPLIGDKVAFEDLRLADDLTIVIPDRLLDVKHQEAMRKILVPPPATKADEIVAAMGGTVLHAGGAAPAALPHEGRALREGRSALHHRGDEDVQQGRRAFAGTVDRGAGRRRRSSCARASRSSRSRPTSARRGGPARARRASAQATDALLAKLVALTVAPSARTAAYFCSQAVSLSRTDWLIRVRCSTAERAARPSSRRDRIRAGAAARPVGPHRATALPAAGVDVCSTSSCAHRLDRPDHAPQRGARAAAIAKILMR
jgi:hypothetical protein